MVDSLAEKAEVDILGIVLKVPLTEDFVSICVELGTVTLSNVLGRLDGDACGAVADSVATDAREYALVGTNSIVVDSIVVPSVVEEFELSVKKACSFEVGKRIVEVVVARIEVVPAALAVVVTFALGVVV